MKLPLVLSSFCLVILLPAFNQKEAQLSNTLSAVPHVKLKLPQFAESHDLVVYDAATSICGEWFSVQADEDCPVTFILNRDRTFRYIENTGLKDTVKGKWETDGALYFLRTQRAAYPKENLSATKRPWLFEKKLRFIGGFFYEVDCYDSLSRDYFVQSKSYAPYPLVCKF